jgi:rod shape determining protein RodA
MNIRTAKWGMWLSVLAINAIGLATIFSVTRYSSAGIRGSFKHQIMFLVIAVIATILACRLPARFWKVMTPWTYLVTLIALIAVLVIGQKINGATSWIRLPGLSIQPSELLKFSLVLALARCLSVSRESSRLQDFLLVCVIAAVPLLLILKQPDLGTAMTLIPMIIGVTYLAGYDLPHMGMLLGLGSLSFMVLMVSAINEWQWIPIHAYQLGRIVRLFHQDGMSPLLSLGEISPHFILWTSIALGSLALYWAGSWKKVVWILLIAGHAVPFYQWSSQTLETRVAVNEKFLKPFRSRRTIEEPQLRGAKFALANGGSTGQGWRQGEQTQYQRLAYAYSDLIFAAFAEEWGYLGSLTLISLYGLLIACMMTMAYRVDNRFSALVIGGTAFMLMAQVFIHIGYTTGLLPMTGTTLPFMSAGGTSLVVTWMSVAVVHSCASTKDFVV